MSENGQKQTKRRPASSAWNRAKRKPRRSDKSGVTNTPPCLQSRRQGNRMIGCTDGFKECKRRRSRRRGAPGSRLRSPHACGYYARPTLCVRHLHQHREALENKRIAHSLNNTQCTQGDDAGPEESQTGGTFHAALPAPYYASPMFQQGESSAYVWHSLAMRAFTVDTYAKWLQRGNKGAMDRLDEVAADPSGSKMVARGGGERYKVWTWREESNLQAVVYKMLRGNG
jgi:hypothetical protein